MSNASDFVIENGVLEKYTGSGGDVVIPDGVTSIGDCVFMHCNSLTSITIPAGVTDIGWHTFDDCNKLCSLVVENPSCKFEKNAFARNFPPA